MTKQLDNTMIRELSADEVLVVSGAKPAETYKEPVQVDIMGWTFQSNSRGAVAWWGVKVPGQPREVIFSGGGE